MKNTKLTNIRPELHVVSSFAYQPDEATMVATSVEVDARGRLLELQRQEKALGVLIKAEKDLLIKSMGKHERLVDKHGVELATYKRDADGIKWDKDALALLYPDVFADKRCIWAEEGSMRFLVKK